MKKMPSEYFNRYIADDRHSTFYVQGVYGGGGEGEGTLIYGLD